MEQTYDKEEDILNIGLDDKEYWKSIELPSGLVIDIAKDGTIISIEIMHASAIFKGNGRKVLEVAKTPTLSLP